MPNDAENNNVKLTYANGFSYQGLMIWAKIKKSVTAALAALGENKQLPSTENLTIQKNTTEEGTLNITVTKLGLDVYVTKHESPYTAVTSAIIQKLFNMTATLSQKDIEEILARLDAIAKDMNEDNEITDQIYRVEKRFLTKKEEEEEKFSLKAKHKARLKSVKKLREELLNKPGAKEIPSQNKKIIHAAFGIIPNINYLSEEKIADDLKEMEKFMSENSEKFTEEYEHRIKQTLQKIYKKISKNEDENELNLDAVFEKLAKKAGIKNIQTEEFPEKQKYFEYNTLINSKPTMFSEKSRDNEKKTKLDLYFNLEHIKIAVKFGHEKLKAQHKTQQTLMKTFFEFMATKTQHLEDMLEKNNVLLQNKRNVSNDDSARYSRMEKLIQTEQSTIALQYRCYMAELDSYQFISERFQLKSDGSKEEILEDIERLQTEILQPKPLDEYSMMLYNRINSQTLIISKETTAESSLYQKKQ